MGIIRNTTDQTFLITLPIKINNEIVVGDDRYEFKAPEFTAIKVKPNDAISETYYPAAAARLRFLIDRYNKEQNDKT